jgi:cytochrome P450
MPGYLADFFDRLTTNLVPTMMWIVLEIHKDSTLRSQIRTELKENDLLGYLEPENIKSILTLPRLQGVYAECLRLYNYILVPRETTKDIQVNGWKIPKISTILVSINEAHVDISGWNTGEENSHPIGKFWAERFLSYPDDPNSGPIIKSAIISLGNWHDTKNEANKPDNNEPIFNEKTTAGFWIPYGGGTRICPGRHFAKRAVMTAAAMITSMVDIDILANEKQMMLDQRSYGLGVLRPVGKIPFKLRNWQGNVG